MTFDVDSDTVLASVFSALDEATGESEFPAEVVQQIIETIDNSIPGLIELMTSAGEEIWKDEALNAGGWGRKYIKAIKAKYGENEGTVYLDESVRDSQSGKPSIMFAMMMENGVKSWSIKKALLASDKAWVGKDGVRHIVVPLMVGVPRKSESGKQNSSYGGRVMTKEIHDIVKSGGKVPSGTTIKVSNSSGTKDLDVSGLKQFNNRQYHSGYGIFRMVSDDGKQNWQYPDVPAEPVFASALRKVNEEVSKIIADFSREIVKEFSDL